jgi:hypothetical protein
MYGDGQIMSPDVWYRLNSNDDILLSQAFAAAGVIAAIDQQPAPDWLIEALRDRIQAHVDQPIPWKYPRSKPEWLVDTLTASDLARAWASAITVMPTDWGLHAKPINFAIDPTTLEQRSSRPTIRSIVEVNTLLARSYSSVGPTGVPEPPVVAGMNFDASLPAWAHRWKWPLTIAVTGSKPGALLSQLDSIEAIKTFRFATPRRWERVDAESDLLFIPKSMVIRLGQLALQTAGLVVAYGEGVESDEALTNLALGGEAFPASVSTPMAILPIGRDLLGTWLNSFLFNMSHNFTLDTAVYDAFSEVTKLEKNLARVSPLLVGPTSYLANIRLENRLNDFVERLNRLPDDRQLPLHQNDLAMIGVRSGVKIVGAVRDDLMKAVEDRTSYFHQERDGASDIIKLSEAMNEAEKVEGARTSAESTMEQTNQNPPESVSPDLDVAEGELAEKRYTVLEVYTKAMSPTLVAEPLTSGVAYQLQFSIDTKPGGIPVIGERQEIRPVPQSTDIKLDVVISPDQEDDWDIGDQVLSLTLPPTGRSKNVAKTTIIAKTNGKPAGRRPLFVKLYYKLNLIDSLVFSPFVRRMSLKAKEPTPTDGHPSLFMEYRNEAGRLDAIDLNITPRKVSISIRHSLNDWRLAFALSTDGAAVDLVGHLALTNDALNTIIAEVRDVWGEIVTGPDLYDAARQHEFLPIALRKLACVGRKAWLSMFGATAGGASKSMQKIGQIFCDTPPHQNAIMQITFEDRNIGLVFPWTLIFPGPEAEPPSGEIAIDKFWGWRFIIEQRTIFQNSAPDYLGNNDGKALTLGFAAYKQFAEVASQQSYLDSLASKMKGRVTVTSRIDNRGVLLKNLQDDSLDFLYVFAHGYSRNPGMTNISYFTDWVKTRLPKLKGTAAGGAMQALVENIEAYGNDNASDWIKLSDSTIRLSELVGLSVDLGRSPVVFLNMCHSAQMNPGLFDGFVAYFIGCGARTVLGTECPIPSQFADKFAKKFFDALMRGASLGEALSEARQTFDAKNNPLGLAYSLYGSASTRIVDPLLRNPRLS